jgi:hypothetical protein
MAAVTGEVQIGPHTVRFDTRKLVRLEAVLGKSITTAFTDPGVTVIAAALEVGASITADEALDLMDQLGLVAVGERIGQAVAAAFPKDSKKAADKDPQKAA